MGKIIGSYVHDPPTERFRNVFGIQQFDTDGDAPPLTDKELRRRWASFHDSIRMVSGPWWRRTIGRMLGEDTIRYKVARFMGRPLLKVARAISRREKAAAPEESVKLSHKSARTSFPLNYVPQKLSTWMPTMPEEVHFDHVAIHVIDESVGSPLDSISALNQVIETTAATWLFLQNGLATTHERDATLSVLLASVSQGDDVVYADEAGTDPYAPILKSLAVGPHTLLSYNVIGRPALVRVAALRAVGGFSQEAGWAYEHDAYLRLNETGAQFHHVARVLPVGRAPGDFERSRIDQDTCRVVRAALARRNWQGRVEPDEVAGVVHWTLEVPAPAPSIDIIIPTRDRLDLVRRCINAIESITTYPNFNVIILDNDSKETETLDFFATTSYQVVPCPGPFNYAHIVNRGVKHSNADYIVTLNNDTIVITPDWLERMIGLASLPDVGFVGACLIDQDGHYEHESIVISPYPQHLRSDSNYPHRDQFVVAIRDVAAVTGAVQMVRRDLWQSLGGMDEQLKVTMNDVDICLRSQLQDRHVVYTPDVKLYHHVSSSRGELDPLDDRNRFIRRWDIFGTFRDPYFPESLLLLGEQMYYRHRER